MADDTTTEWYRDPSIVKTIYELAITRGIIVKPSVETVDANAAVSISALVTPSYFPRELYLLGQDIAPALNELIDAVSRHHDFLAAALEKLVGAVTRRIWCKISFSPLLFFSISLTRSHIHSQCCGGR